MFWQLLIKFIFISFRQFNVIRILQEEIDKMTLLVADQDADIKAKQEYISKQTNNREEKCIFENLFKR